MNSLHFRSVASVSILTSALLASCAAKKTETAPPPPQQLAGTPQNSKTENTPAQSFAPEHVTPPNERVAGDLNISVQQLQNLIDTEFLYGANLQFAKMKDESLGFDSQQSLAQGNLKIGRFKRTTSRLQFIVDESIATESDFPLEKIYLDFRIISESDEGIKLQLENVGSGAQQVWELTRVAQRWLRSLDFFKNDSTFVLETSVEVEDKENQPAIYHFAEFIIPRAPFGTMEKAIIRQDEPSAKQDKNYLSWLDRLGVFSVESWFRPQMTTDWPDKVVKIKKSTVSHFDLSDGKTIEWYVTANLPDDLLLDIKAGVEGWNRYFQGFSADKVMRFMGKLPATAKLGDPRYNVIRFDQVSEAGAAYESSNNDPQTGLQVHALIYMPFSWYKSGIKDFVDTLSHQDGSKARAVSSTTRFFTRTKSSAPRCLRDIDFQSESLALMLENSVTAEQAGRALMRSTLLHEVGHALGMDHNFRGSNQGRLNTRTSGSWKYSSSVMDYNTPFVEDKELFTDLNTRGEAIDPVKGKVLDYDLQFIDTIYNRARQLSAAPTKYAPLGYCNDADADDFVDGVNPTCLRYDVFAHPQETLQFLNTRLDASRKRTLDADGGYLTLAGGIDLVVEEGIRKLSEASGDEVEKVFKQTLQKLINTEKLYFISGHASLKSLQAELIALLGEWKALPDDLQRDDEQTQLSGWSSLPIFNSEQKASADLYIAYQNKTRADLLAQIKRSLNPNADIRSRGAHTKLTEAFATLKAASAAQKLSDTIISAQEKSFIASIKETEQKILDGAIKRISEIPLAVAQRDAGKEQEPKNGLKTRPNLSAALLLEVMKAFEQLLAAPDVRSSSKLSVGKCVDALLKERPLNWDPADVRRSIDRSRDAMLHSVERSFLTLDKKLKTSGYLNQEEREDHNNLGQSLELLKTKRKRNKI